MEVVSSDTGVTVSVLVTVVGAVVWMTKIWALARRNKEEVAQMAEAVKHIEEVQARAHEKTAKRIHEVEKQNAGVLDRMARIETKIDLLIEHFKK